MPVVPSVFSLQVIPCPVSGIKLQLRMMRSVPKFEDVIDKSVIIKEHLILGMETE